jgi:hypothetical protein
MSALSEIERLFIETKAAKPFYEILTFVPFCGRKIRVNIGNLLLEKIRSK